MDRSLVRVQAAFFMSLLFMAANCEEQQAKLSLINFMDKLSGGNAKKWGWTNSSDPCIDKWSGVTCSSRMGLVKHIVLDELNLTGTFDAGLVCKVTSLAKLSLNRNNISGQIPEDIGSCSQQLTHLYLSGNQFTGGLPASLSRLVNLKVLDISDNHFSDMLPDLSHISGLVSFLAQNNKLSGEVPSFDFTNLKQFNVSNNNFSGPTPDVKGQFTAESFLGNPGLCGKPLDKACPQAPPPSPPANSVALHGVENQKESSPHSSSSRISPALLLTTVILAAVFFTAGIVHLLIRYLIKRPSFSPVYQSNRYPEDSVTQGLQRQLQQLFRLHDSGLDQAFVDALPVFCYRDVIGLKDPFDCAVCLCEFSDEDRLRLLPMCSHAFHIDCIDTWLLSNSTCPLCRGSLVNSNFPMENSVFNFDYLTDMSSRSPQNGENGSCSSQKPGILGEKRVFSVRLGKFRSTNVGERSEEREEQLGDEMSSSSLDARRCFSMGAFQYVVDDTTLQVALSASGSHGDGDLMKKEKGRDTGCSSVDGDMEEKKIRRVRGESFSVSKIWLWSKRSKFQDSSGSPASWSLYL